MSRQGWDSTWYDDIKYQKINIYRRLEERVIDVLVAQINPGTGVKFVNISDTGKRPRFDLQRETWQWFTQSEGTYIFIFNNHIFVGGITTIQH